MADDYMSYKGMRTLGDRYAKSGEYQKAIECYQKALAASPHEYGSQVLVDRINSLLAKVQNNQSAGKKSAPSPAQKKQPDATSAQKEHEPKPQLNSKTTFMPCRIYVLLSTSEEIPEEACQPLSESIWNSIRQEEPKFDQMIEATVGQNVPAEFQWTPIVCNDKQQFINLAKDPHDSWMTSTVESTEAEYYAPFVGAGSFQTNDLGPRSQNVHYVMTVLVFGSGKKDSGCFIATACYGDINHPDVRILRGYRDEVLLRHCSGRVVTKIYYLVSPAIARRLSKNSRLSELVRTKLLMPLVKGIRSTRRSRKKWSSTIHD